MNHDSPSQPNGKRKRRYTKIIRYGLGALLILLIAGYITRRQIGNLLARQLDQRLSAAGVYIDWRSAEWIAGPGIRLRDLAVYRDAMKRDRIALLDNVSALKSDPGWDNWSNLTVKTSSSKLALGGGENETVLENLEVNLLILPGKADLLRLDASFGGLNIRAKGNYVRSAQSPEPEKEGLFDDLNLDGLKTVKEWVSFQPQQGPPTLDLEFHSSADGSSTGITAVLDGKALKWRGQDWDEIRADIKATISGNETRAEIERIRIGHAGRLAELNGGYDSASGILRINKFDCGIDVVRLARAMSPAGSLDELSSNGQWSISAHGDIPVASPNTSRIEGNVALDGDITWASGKTRVTLENPSFPVQMNKGVVAIPGFKAGLWNGALEIPMTSVRLAEAETPAGFETQISLQGASLQSIMASFKPDEKQPGTVHMTWKGGGGFDLRSITGSGSLKIQDAEFFRIPLLGPLHLVLDQVSPGFGRDVASSLTASHRLNEGNLHINQLKLDSKLTRIEVDGVIDLERSYANLSAKAKFHSLMGKVTAVISSLLEIEGSGPVSDISWRLKNMPGTETVGDAASTVGKTGAAAIKGAGKVGSETGKAAKKIFKLPGKLLPGK